MVCHIRRYGMWISAINKAGLTLHKSELWGGGVIYQAVMSHPHFYTIYHQNPDIYHCKFSRLPLLKTIHLPGGQVPPPFFFGFYYWIDAITITLTKWFNVVQLNNATQTIFRDGAQPLSMQWPARRAQEKVLEAEKSFFKQLAIGWGGISLNVGGHCRFFASCSLCCWLKRLPEWKIDTLIMMT